MKKLILLNLALLFLATTFQSDNPPGWYVQTLTVNKNVTDIFFIDSIKGWSVTEWGPQFDTGYILNTTNGGDIWNVQFRGHLNFNVLSFPTDSIGYAGGGDGFPKLYKTINGGLNWMLVSPPPVHLIQDSYFANKDTGWTCDDILFGGLYKTTNGSLSWVQQLDASYKIQKIFFLNKDTGWAGSSTGVLYKTIDGGSNWQQVFDFPGIFGVLGMEFVNLNTGWLTTTAIFKTTNGGANWMQYGGGEVGAEYSFISQYTGWASSDNYRVVKTTNSGINWFYQSVPIENALSLSAVDSLKAWAGGSGIVYTTNGGLTTIESSAEIPNNFFLNQNYPNPFNPTTNLEFGISKSGFVSLKVYDITGKEIAILVNENLNPGTYKYQFDGSGLTSGVYFYTLKVNGLSETKRMIMVK